MRKRCKGTKTHEKCTLQLRERELYGQQGYATDYRQQSSQQRPHPYIPADTHIQAVSNPAILTHNSIAATS